MQRLSLLDRGILQDIELQNKLRVLLVPGYQDFQSCIIQRRPYVVCIALDITYRSIM